MIIDGLLNEGICGSFQEPIQVDRSIGRSEDDRRDVGQGQMGSRAGHGQVAIASRQAEAENDQIGPDFKAR